MLSFFLNGQPVEENNLDADITLLRYLRVQKSLTGTKEGCASGDCGACTVLVGECTHGKWQYQAINSCITFLSQLAGKSIITVEALSTNGNTLHPAQSAMVECNGSQCGFCTPGIVMSMAALFETHNGKSATRAEIEQALAGNLCRCTGYQPIMAAANKMLENKHMVNLWRPDAPPEKPSDICLDNEQSHAWTPRTEQALTQLLNKNPDARLVAGATDLALEVTQAQQTITKLIYLGLIPELTAIDKAEDKLIIGAAATFQNIHAALTEHFPEFGQMLSRLGSQQIRNSGTMGGNIVNASPIGDTPPVLIALQATLELASEKGVRTLPIEQFFIDYKKTALKTGEYLRAIHVPLLKKNEILKVFKISKRLEDDISTALMAAKFTIENNHIKHVKTGFGGMAPIPKAAINLENALVNQALQESTFDSAKASIRQDFQPIDDVRASAEYRLRVAENLVLKAGIELIDPGKVTRVEQIKASTIGNVVGVTGA